MGPMRILFVHNLPPWDPRAGGGQKAHHALACEAVAAGHEVRGIFVGGQAQPPPDHEPPYPFLHTAGRNRLLLDVAGVAATTRALQASWSPDVVFASAAEGAGSVGAAPPGAVVAVASHHPDPPDLRDAPSPWLRPWAALQRARRLQGPLLERWMLRQADVVFAVSAWGARTLVERGYLPHAERVAVVRNGVAPEWFQRPDPPLPTPCDLLFVGRLDPQKGVDLLLDALRRLPGTTLRIVGDGPQGEELRRTAADPALAERITFAGALDPHGVRAHMATAGALVLPSRTENYPLVLLEAMAAGVPVVATAVGGVAELLDDGAAGWLAPPRDPAALADVLRRMASDPDARAERVRRGRVQAEAHGWDRVWARIEERLLALLGERQQDR